MDHDDLPPHAVEQPEAMISTDTKSTQQNPTVSNANSENPETDVTMTNIASGPEEDIDEKNVSEFTPDHLTEPEQVGIDPEIVTESLSLQRPTSEASHVPSVIDEQIFTTPGSLATSASTSAGNTISLRTVPGSIKKKELMRPLFSRSSTTDKVVSKVGASKSMIVETETVDSSNTPTVTLPIASSSSNVISGDLMSNNSGIASNLASLRSKKSTIFIDQNNQPIVQPTSGTVFENDNASITGSVRNPIKRLNPADSHLNISKPGATKADLFAAKVANAVGDGSDSDSEETFVYESAPDALSTNTLPSNKTIAALGSSNPLALRKLSQRNISMPVTSAAHPYSPSLTSHLVVAEDSKDHTVTYDTEEDSDHTSNQDQKTLTKSSTDSHNAPSKGTLFTKYNGGSRKPSTVSLLASQKVANMSQLRTTTSKLFDVKGSTLRRYSGVPDDVNIEDYLDQYDEEADVGASDYADSYHYEDEDEDDELTPLNVNNANHNLRNKMSNHYQTKRSVANFGSVDCGDALPDLGPSKDETVLRRPRSLKSKRYPRNYQQSQQEQQQYSPHNFYNKKRNSKIQLLKNVMCLSVTVFILLAVGFVGGFLLANTKELQEVQIVSIDDIIVSFDELVFDLSVGSYNHGLMTVAISDVELDIFAKSSYAKMPPILPVTDDAQGEVQTILLGSVSKFETPLQFPGGFFHRNYTISRGEIKLIHPGQNATDPGSDQENHKSENDLEKWRKIIKHPFDMIVKGRFTYEVPLLRTEQSVAVMKTVSIDPSEDEMEISL